MSKKTYVLDCGVNQSTLYDSQNDVVTTISHEDVLELHQKLEPNSTLVCEYAHLGCPRGKRSLSQPFTAEELLTLYDDLKHNNITLKLFPQQSTPRACAYSGMEKSDENDVKSIYLLLKDFPEISLMNPPEKFNMEESTNFVSEKRKWSWTMKGNINYTLNLARRYKYLDEDDENTKLIKELMSEMESQLSHETKEAFGLLNCRYTNNRKGKWKAGDVCWNKISMPQIYSVLSCLQDESGKLRVDAEYGGKLPSWKFAKKYLIGMTPFHFRGGVARSNLYYHGMKNYIIRKAKEDGVKLKSKKRGGFFDDDGKTFKEGTKFTKEEDNCFLHHRKNYNHAIRELYRFFQDRLPKYQKKKIENAGLPE